MAKKGLAFLVVFAHSVMFYLISTMCCIFPFSRHTEHVIAYTVVNVLGVFFFMVCNLDLKWYRVSSLVHEPKPPRGALFFGSMSLWSLHICVDLRAFEVLLSGVCPLKPYVLMELAELLLVNFIDRYYSCALKCHQSWSLTYGCARHIQIIDGLQLIIMCSSSFIDKKKPEKLKSR